MQDIWNKFFENNHQTVVEMVNGQFLNIHIAEGLHVSGLSLLCLGHRKEGFNRLRVANDLIPSNKFWFSNAATVSLQINEPKISIEFSSEGLKHHQGDGDLLFALGNAHMALRDFPPAIDAFQKALDGNPDMLDARLNLGNCHRRLGSSKAAMENYDILLQNDPLHVNAKLNKGGLLMEMGSLHAGYEMLKNIPPDILDLHPDAKFLLSLASLTLGDYKTGWDLYRARWECDFSKEDRVQFSRPLANSLDEISGKNIVVSHEQGFGDSLQFIRFIPMISKHANVTVLCPPHLWRLFRHSFPDIPMVIRREDLPDYEFEIPLLNLPYLLGTDLGTIPDCPYLSVPETIQEDREQAQKGLLKVGLVWAGQRRQNPDMAAIDARRSIRLLELEPLLRIPGILWHSLQMGAPSRELDEYRMHIMAPLKEGFDFLDTAAIIKQLDLVITVDTAVAHLSAALGVPTWVLSRHDGCWRWLHERDDSPWYPNILRLFRQPEAGSWWPVVERVTEALSTLVANQ